MAQPNPTSEELSHSAGPSEPPEPVADKAKSGTSPAPAENATETTYDAPIEAGDDNEDDGFGSDGLSTGSTSITSSINKHIYENGRRYHKFHQGTYTVPNDEQEQDREDMKHACVQRLCEGRLIYAPIGDNPQHIVDLGTGTGIWAIEVGEMYPSAIVEGLDLSPIQPNWVPPNVKFTVDDIEDEFVYPPNHFDLIHTRHLIPHIKNIQGLMDHCYTHLKPGGWIELQEHEHNFSCDDGTMPENYPVQQMFVLGREGLVNLGFNSLNVLTFDDNLRAAGFVNITRNVMKIPCGPWAKGEDLKMVGLFWRTIMLDGLDGITGITIGKGLGWSKEALEVFLVDVRKALMDKTVHAYCPLHIVTAQKPV